MEWEEKEIKNWWLYDDCTVSRTLNPANSFPVKGSNNLNDQNNQ